MEPKRPVTHEYLIEAVRRMRADLPALDDAGLRFSLAADVLINLFGRDWAKEHLFSKRSQLSLSAGNEGSPHMWVQHRLERLAEAFFVMQDVTRFDRRLQRAQADDVMATLAELELARVFRAAGASVSFVEESRQRGFDYDFEASIGDAIRCPVEVKSKADGDPSSTSLWRSLDEARRQLPTDRPGVVCARVPAGWAQYGTLPLTIITAVNKLFRQSDRVGIAVVQWESVETTAPPYLIAVRRLAFSNPQLRDRYPWMEPLASRLPSVSDGFHLGEIVSEVDRL